MEPPRVLRKDEEYRVIEHPTAPAGQGDLSLLKRVGVMGMDGEFCCGSVERTEDDKWTVTIAAPLRLDEHSIREIGTFESRQQALTALWGQRLWMHWGYWT